MKFIALGLILLMALWVVPGDLPAQSETQKKQDYPNLPFGWGPFQSPTPLSPFQKLRMVFFHQPPLIRPQGSIFVSSTLTWANLWVPPGGRVFMDVEAWSINEFVEYSISDRFAVSLFLPFIFINGGFMDGFIEGFHNTFGLGNMDREKHPRNDVHLEVVQKDGTVVPIVNSKGNSFWRRAPVLSFRMRLNSLTSKFPMTFKVSFDFPEMETKTNIIEDDGRDWGVGLVGAFNFLAKWSGNISIGHTRLRESKVGKQFELVDFENSLMVSFDYTESEDFAYIFQFSLESPVARNTDSGFDKTTNSFLAGVKWMLKGGDIFELAFAENVGISDNSADFAFHGGYGARF